MTLESKLVSVLDQIPEPGDECVVTGVLDGDGYEVAGELYATPDGVSYDLVFTNTGGAVLLTGIARAEVATSCARCLEPVSLRVSGEVEGFYVMSDDPQAPTDEDGEAFGPDEFERLDDDGSIDIAEPVTAALILETPVMPLCRENCKGLCPVCGHNLNEGDCEHVGAADPFDEAANPFSVLKGLTFDE